MGLCDKHMDHYQHCLVCVIDELREERDNLRGLFEHAAQLSWDVGDIDGGDFQDEAERRKLMVTVPATEEIAAEYDTDVMFTWAWSTLNKEGDEG